MRITKSVGRWVAIPTVLVLLLALVMVPAPVKASPDVAISAVGAYNAALDKGPFDTVDEGAEFWVKINVGAEADTVAGFDAADYLITYDPLVLSVALTNEGHATYYEVTGGNIVYGDIGAEGPTETPNVPVVQTREIGEHGAQGSGVIKVVNNVEGTGPGLTGWGFLCGIKFTVIGSDPSSSAITPSQVTLSDVDANEITTATPTAVTITVDKLEVTGITVVGETDWVSQVTNEGYVSTTTFTLTATVTGGCGEYTGATPYAWTSTGATFGAAATATVTNTVTYATLGTKSDIRARVTDDLGSTSEGDEVLGIAEVYDTFTFDFTEDRLMGIQGDIRPTKDNTILFNSTNTTAGGTLSYTYDWGDFGGGTGTPTDANPDVTFAPPGTRTGLIYTVGVTAKDALAAEITPATHSITIYQLGDVNVDNIVKATDITESELIVGGVHGETFTSDVNMISGKDAGDITATEVAVAESYEAP